MSELQQSQENIYDPGLIDRKPPRDPTQRYDPKAATKTDQCSTLSYHIKQYHANDVGNKAGKQMATQEQ